VQRWLRPQREQRKWSALTTMRFETGPAWLRLVRLAMEANTAEVKSVVQPADSSNQPIQINYLVKQTEGDWKVYDVTVDDISITANYRNQFTRMIDQQGFDGLMSAMRKKQ